MLPCDTRVRPSVGVFPGAQLLELRRRALGALVDARAKRLALAVEQEVGPDARAQRTRSRAPRGSAPHRRRPTRSRRRCPARRGTAATPQPGVDDELLHGLRVGRRPATAYIGGVLQVRARDRPHRGGDLPRRPGRSQRRQPRDRHRGAPRRPSRPGSSVRTTTPTSCATSTASASAEHPEDPEPPAVDAGPASAARRSPGRRPARRTSAGCVVEKKLIPMKLNHSVARPTSARIAALRPFQPAVARACR